MFEFWRDTWRILFGKKRERVPLDPDRVDKLSLEDWGMGEAPKMLEGGTVVYPAGFNEDPRGGYGGPAIPGDDLPASIPRTGAPPTYKFARNVPLGDVHGVPEPHNFTHLAEVKNPPNTHSASITNGYDRDILLEGPVLKMFLKKGETRTIRGPVFQRVARFPGERPNERFNPSAFTIVGHNAVDVLKDMAAERTRSILRGETGSPYAVDHITVGRLLELSKFTVTEIPDGPVRAGDGSDSSRQTA
jgi:hypothetical protein